MVTFDRLKHERKEQALLKNQTDKGNASPLMD